ncbi:DNA-binding transcriptional regulator, PucR family [Lentzea albidocapillata]|uniref:DNA-binding transcriptional regulator, PucR family n=2 Tax=Lentzea albidocapillata TaxID=40571 RepID=A0A1W2FTL1_9PSEU|nr:DNA-binding transcriptional regulator, PucR family [Lentzea albidocapillata]
MTDPLLPPVSEVAREPEAPWSQLRDDVVDGEGGEDLFDVVDSIARLIDGPVVVEDVDFRVLAYSAIAGQPNDEARRSAILNRRTPDRWLRWMEESGVRHQLAHGDGVIRLNIPWSSPLPRYIQPIRTAGQLVGYLWFMKGSGEFAEGFERIAREFASLLAPELARRSWALNENPGGRLLRQFLAGGMPAARLAEVLKVDHETVGTAVVVFEVEAEAPDVVGVRARAVRELARFAQMRLHAGLAGSVDQQIYLLNAADSLDDRGLAVLVEKTATHLERVLRVDVRAAAGAVRHGLTTAAMSREEADVAMRVLASRSGGRRLGCFSDMRHEILLHEVVSGLRARPLLTRGLLDRLNDHDRVHSTDYEETLSVYLNSFGDVSAAADRLHIHANSLRYRLKRLAEIAELDLEDPQTRLALQLVLAAR